MYKQNEIKTTKMRILTQIIHWIILEIHLCVCACTYAAGYKCNVQINKKNIKHYSLKPCNCVWLAVMPAGGNATF